MGGPMLNMWLQERLTLDSEEDTFKILKRPPIHELMYLWVNRTSDITVAKFLEDHFWKEKDFNEAYRVWIDNVRR